MRILLVEDDEQIREVIKDYFGNHAREYELECAENGPKGLAMLRNNPYDLLLLDVMLPGMSGFSLLRELRRTSSLPVIMITAKIREEDRLRGYELGCDDYVCKPFSIAELCAKIGAVLRRTGNSKGSEAEKDRILNCGPIIVNASRREVTVESQKVTLSPKEYDLLVTFMEHPNWIFTREMLLGRIWGMDYDGTERTVDNHVKKLRRSLGTAGKMIKTVFRKGYRLEWEEK